MGKSDSRFSLKRVLPAHPSIALIVRDYSRFVPVSTKRGCSRYSVTKVKRHAPCHFFFLISSHFRRVTRVDPKGTFSHVFRVRFSSFSLEVKPRVSPCWNWGKIGETSAARWPKVIYLLLQISIEPRGTAGRAQGERARCAERSSHSAESAVGRARDGGANGTRPDARIAREPVGVSLSRDVGRLRRRGGGRGEESGKETGERSDGRGGRRGLSKWDGNRMTAWQQPPSHPPR